MSIPHETPRCIETFEESLYPVMDRRGLQIADFTLFNQERAEEAIMDQEHKGIEESRSKAK